MWRLGMQCEGLVLDPIRLAALVVMNQAVWPSSLGMEAEAPREPYSAGGLPYGSRSDLEEVRKHEVRRAHGAFASVLNG
jgi:hypothetical protein